MCPETWNFPVFGSAWHSWGSWCREEERPRRLLQISWPHKCGSLSWSSWCCLVWLGFNSITYWTFPPSECTGDLWCFWYLVAVLCGKQGRSCSPPEVLACINQFLCLQLPEGPQFSPVCIKWSWAVSMVLTQVKGPAGTRAVCAQFTVLGRAAGEKEHNVWRCSGNLKDWMFPQWHIPLELSMEQCLVFIYCCWK